jgi:succinate dehydrogenase/fumarate reductase-like Fe-S protein
MEISLRIKRFDPGADRRPHWLRYTVEAEPLDRVLEPSTTSSGPSTGR